MTNTATSCSACKHEVEPGQLITFGKDYVCNRCKEEYVQSLKEGVEPLDGSRISDDAFCYGNRLVIRRGDRIPQEICYRCGDHATRTKKFKLVTGRHFWKLQPVSLSAGICAMHHRRKSMVFPFMVIGHLAIVAAGLLLKMRGNLSGAAIMLPHLLLVPVPIIFSSVCRAFLPRILRVPDLKCTNATNEGIADGEYLRITGFGDEYLNPFADRQNKSK